MQTAIMYVLLAIVRALRIGADSSAWLQWFYIRQRSRLNFLAKIKTYREVIRLKYDFPESNDNR